MSEQVICPLLRLDTNMERVMSSFLAGSWKTEALSLLRANALPRALERSDARGKRASGRNYRP